MSPNIYIIGAQSSGKTTLVQALETHFTNQHETLSASAAPRFIKEVARKVLDKHGYTAEDIVTSPQRTLQLQKLIIEAQARAEYEPANSDTPATNATCPPSFISDRSAIDPVVYARQYVGLQESQGLLELPEWRQMHKRMQASLIILCEPRSDWLKSDGVRLMPRDNEEWMLTHKLFCDVLNEVGLSFVVLSEGMSDIKVRVGFVLEHIE
ncbi:AAA domain-containing protein [Microdochium trichocladiopsis]|uniref:AAA domain-containing protein n=1 Tax=Microdochium trichocladiopsis TaxID=1682393 RepID=A0A9P8XSY4_9PEZI|nr:AAA domain-containing protein [Microdochium trichocladiopsis]KAH7016363.1 AAA domain-containing protein [Microdochium trichocladiopsis]